MKYETSLLSGSTPMLILSLLQDGDKYGYEMVAALAARSDNVFELKEGTLYPLLHTLEKNKYVSSYEKAAPSGRIRKYYRLTKAGQQQLQQRETEWKIFRDKVDLVLGYSGV